MAPEVVKKENSNFKRDIWSLGVVLYALLTACTPFYGPDQEATRDAILHKKLAFTDEVWQEVSDSCKDLLQKMLYKDQSLRPSIKEVLRHPWML